MNVRMVRSVALVVLFALVSMGAYAPARAAGKPEVIPVDSTELWTLCTFPMTFRTIGDIQIREGADLIQYNWKLKHIFTNLDNGHSFFTPDDGVGRFVKNSDGTVTGAENGILTRIVIPGEGLAWIFTGRIVWLYPEDPSAPRELVFQSNSIDSWDHFDAAVCRALQ